MFLNSTFVDPETMPGWLEAFVNVNPITSVIDAIRGLMLGGPVAGSMIESAIWMAVNHGGVRTARDRTVPPARLIRRAVAEHHGVREGSKVRTLPATPSHDVPGQVIV